MKFEPIKAYVNKYALYLKAFAVCAVVGLSAYAGGAATANHYKVLLARQDTALNTASLQLQSAANALDAQDRANAQMIVDANLQAASAKVASKVADAARVVAENNAAAYAKRLENAKKHPNCALLLDSDVQKVCGL